MIKIAFNREKPNLVFIIDKVTRIKLVPNAIVEYYEGVLRDTNPVPDTSVEKPYKIQVTAFEMKWREVPLDITGTTDLNIQPSKTVTPTLSEQTVTADVDYTGLGKVVVKATPTEVRTVTPTTAQQVIRPNSPAIAMTQVTVNAAPTETKTVTPTTSRQTLTPSGSNVGFSTVTVNAVTSSIDSNIRPENIKAGVTILGVTGTYEGEE